MQAQPSQLQNSQPGNDTISPIPQPVFYGRIEFLYEGRTISYTDCWQISMLRFLHLIFADGDKISQQKLTHFMDKQEPICQSLIQYFTLNPSCSISSKYYATQEGWKIRSEWCQFCNNSKVLKVKLEEKFEVEATIENSIRFFKAFFPKLELKQVKTVQLTLQSLRNKILFEYYDKILNSIYQQLSFNYKINVHIESQSGDFGDNYLLSALQQIFIDGQHLLDWEIYSFYQFDSETLWKRQTGHSDYRLH